MNITDKPTQKQLLEYLKYNEKTGELIWIKRPSRRIHINKRAGSLKKSGYRVLDFKGKRYYEHQIIWCMVYGYYPPMIDHINHIKNDNRLENLRAVSAKQNAQNQSKRKNNLNEAGIYYNKKTFKYIACISMDGKKVYQKSFDNIDEAIKQRKAKLIELGFNKNHGE